MKCKTCGREEPRSSEQNRRYWKILGLLAEKPVQGNRFSSEAWHIYLKFKFLGAEDIKIPNGKVLTQAKSTAGLTKPDFNDYMTMVEIWCNEHDIYLDE
jgi:hypothetical protein